MHKGGYEAIFNTDPESLVNTHFIQYSWVGHGVRLDSQLIAVTKVNLLHCQLVTNLNFNIFIPPFCWNISSVHKYGKCQQYQPCSIEIQYWVCSTGAINVAIWSWYKASASLHKFAIFFGL